jgi:hypothetical protein
VETTRERRRRREPAQTGRLHQTDVAPDGHEERLPA